MGKFFYPLPNAPIIYNFFEVLIFFSLIRIWASLIFLLENFGFGFKLSIETDCNNNLLSIAA